ncbi:unnamed protein product, partial [Amoebophrya sp. A25]|eukprot:GSA25T00010164001.1
MHLKSVMTDPSLPHKTSRTNDQRVVSDDVYTLFPPRGGYLDWTVNFTGKNAVESDVE